MLFVLGIACESKSSRCRCCKETIKSEIPTNMVVKDKHKATATAEQRNRRQQPHLGCPSSSSHSLGEFTSADENMFIIKYYLHNNYLFVLFVSKHAVSGIDPFVQSHLGFALNFPLTECAHTSIARSRTGYVFDSHVKKSTLVIIPFQLSRDVISTLCDKRIRLSPITERVSGEWKAQKQLSSA